MDTIFTPPRENIGPMKTTHIPLVAAMLLAIASLCATAQKLDVFADQIFQPALREIAPIFSNQTGFKIHLSRGSSSELAERILSGASADVFFPASEEAMRQVMEKGLVDVALKRIILNLPSPAPEADGVPTEPQHISAAVMANAANRLQAMAFLEFLASEAARDVFARQGFSLP